MTNYTDGVTNVVIKWDDADGEYCAGQVLTGNIEVTVSETTKFRGVILKVLASFTFILISILF